METSIDSAILLGAEPSVKACIRRRPHRARGRLLSSSQKLNCLNHGRRDSTAPFQDGICFLSPLRAAVKAFIITSFGSCATLCWLWAGFPRTSKALWTGWGWGGNAEASKVCIKLAALTDPTPCIGGCPMLAPKLCGWPTPLRGGFPLMKPASCIPPESNCWENIGLTWQGTEKLCCTFGMGFGLIKGAPAIEPGLPTYWLLMLGNPTPWHPLPGAISSGLELPAVGIMPEKRPLGANDTGTEAPDRPWCDCRIEASPAERLLAWPWPVDEELRPE